MRGGDRISAHYDPMIAKVTRTPPAAARRCSGCARRSGAPQIAGTATNLGFLQALCLDPDFAAGRMDTGLIGRKQAALTHVGPPGDAAVLFAAMAALDLDPARPRFGFRLWGSAGRRIELVCDGQIVARDLRLLGPHHIAVEDGDRSVAFEAVTVGPDGMRARQAGATCSPASPGSATPSRSCSTAGSPTSRSSTRSPSSGRAALPTTASPRR